MMKSWKTTSSGITLFALGAYSLYEAVSTKTLTQMIFMAAVGNIVTGIGLMFARDNNRSSEQVGAGGKPAVVTPAEP